MKKLLLASDLSPRILQEVVSNRADLLVLGTHGRTGVAHAFLGSVAEEPLGEAPSDVLVARAW